MPRPAKSPDEKLATIARAQALMDGGMSRNEALRSVGISRAQFYRYRRDLGGVTFPVVNMDWQSMAANWRPDGLGEVSDAELKKLRREVAAELQMVFGRPAIRRTYVDHFSLRAFADAFAKASDRYAALDDSARVHLEGLLEPDRLKRSFATLFEAAAALEQDLTDYLDAWAEQASDLGEAGGGPPSDPRVQNLIIALAGIYTRHCPQKLTHSSNPEDGLPSSPFNRFVASVRRHFLNDPGFSHLTDNAFNEAMRHTSARLDFSDDAENGC